MTSEQRPERREGVNHVIPGEGNSRGGQSKVKSHKAESLLACSGYPKESVWLEESKETEREKEGKSEQKWPNPVR